MIQYLQFGPLQIPTFGLLVALALITAAYILQADFDRRGMDADAFAMITAAGLAGILGAKLYHLLEPDHRQLFFEHPGTQLLSRYGFAWFGGFLGGFIAMVLMGWRAKLKIWEFLDACSPAASFGYAIGRIGCFLSGDGDYGKPTSLPWGMSFPHGAVPTSGPTGTCVQWGAAENCRVHPTPLYELFVWCVIGWLLWRLGARALEKPRPMGELFCLYLILTGSARFLMELIRINPPWILGLSNAQVASAISVIGGLALLIFLERARAVKP